MSIQSEIDRIEQNVADTYSVLAEAGAPMPASMDSDNLAGTAANIAAVLFNKAQSLTNNQQAQGRNNINAITGSDLTLAIGVDGLLYIFAKGVQVGTGIEITPSGDIIGYVDANNNVVLKGNLADGTYSIKYELEDGSTVDIGNLVLDSNTYYSVTTNLTNCTINNSATEVVEGGSYSATITANSGYELKTVSVTMGGSAVTVTNGVINIASVTGNIVITAVAEVYAPSYTNLFDPSSAQINKRVNSSYVLVDAPGKFTTNFMNVSGKVPFTANTKIYIKGATFTNDGNTKIITYKTTGTAYTGEYSASFGSNLMSRIQDEGNGIISISGVADSFPLGVVRMCMTLQKSTSSITADSIKDVVITINEPIS